MKVLIKVLVLVVSLGVSLSADNIDKFVAAAKEQVGKTLTYNPEYVKLSYPMGDIELSKGVCTDVVVRAMRKLNIDLQREIYLDKKAHPKRYRGLYYTNRLDTNIDHRRVKNIQVYLAAKGYRVKDKFKAGDIVIWKLPTTPNELDHIGICSHNKNAQGEPLIIHNVGAGAKEEDVLREYRIVDHFRVMG
ncbi:MAG: DUF1287 domain-containing protein [Campylobacterales bacterium]|nr:DUF1287 domain-containing protein [Campylobacterales bacterium]